MDDHETDIGGRREKQATRLTQSTDLHRIASLPMIAPKPKGVYRSREQAVLISIVGLIGTGAIVLPWFITTGHSWFERSAVLFFAGGHDYGMGGVCSQSSHRPRRTLNDAMTWSSSSFFQWKAKGSAFVMQSFIGGSKGIGR
jgi:hypothetical protein